MIDFDVHIHSDFSTDSQEKQDNIIEKALEKGLKGICFTDHMDIYFPIQCSKKSGGDFTFDIKDYFECLSKIRSRYGDAIKIYFGMEIGLRDEPELKEACLKEYDDIIRRYPFDFIIGSTHCLENIDPYWKEYWDGRTAEEGLIRYFDAIDKNVSFYDNFDSLGHLDYLVRYVSEEAALRSIEKRGLRGFTEKTEGSDGENMEHNTFSYKRVYGREIYSPFDYMDYIDSILKKIIDKGKALEINSAGLKYGLGFAHPKQEILERYRELGGELITIGSDAHIAEHLSFDFDKVYELLKKLGFKYYFVYKDRNPQGFLL